VDQFALNRWWSNPRWYANVKIITFIGGRTVTVDCCCFEALVEHLQTTMFAIKRHLQHLGKLQIGIHHCQVYVSGVCVTASRIVRDGLALEDVKMLTLDWTRPLNPPSEDVAAEE
jgi:hypothetical protein